MIATLTSQLAEFFGEDAERTYESLDKVLGRVEKVRQTVEGAEIYEVIRRRLFEWPKDDEKRQAIEAMPGQRRKPTGPCTRSWARTCPRHVERLAIVTTW